METVNRPADTATLTQACLRRAKHCLWLGGALQAALLDGPLLEAPGLPAGLALACSFVALRLVLPVLLLIACVDAASRHIDAFVTARWDRLVRK